MTPTQAILDSIENRLRELNEEISTLQAARGALGGASGAPNPSRRTRPRRTTNGAAPQTAPDAPKPIQEVSTPAAAPSRPARKPGRAVRRKRASKSGPASVVVPAGKLELLLSESDGLTTSALADRSGGDRAQVLTLLRELEAAGQVRRTGQRRATRWHAITDEDRIRERAAELAARSRSAA